MGKLVAPPARYPKAAGRAHQRRRLAPPLWAETPRFIRGAPGAKAAGHHHSPSARLCPAPAVPAEGTNSSRHPGRESRAGVRRGGGGVGLERVGPRLAPRGQRRGHTVKVTRAGGAAGIAARGRVGRAPGDAASAPPFPGIPLQEPVSAWNSSSRLLLGSQGFAARAASPLPRGTPSPSSPRPWRVLGGHPLTVPCGRAALGPVQASSVHRPPRTPPGTPCLYIQPCS